MKKIKTAGALFDPHEESIYFVAANNIEDVVDVTPWNLCAVNDIAGDVGADPAVAEERARELRVRIDAGNNVLLDSGIFWLTQRHMRKHPGMTMDDALALAPADVEGFDWLFDNYVTLARAFEDRLWGYIELDQGGAANKRKTRAKLESLGLRPIPVYHPINDGWDYFDELCQRYDRICFGNIVAANLHVRRHLLATLWERRRRYPDVWVHVLGMTMSEIATVYPVSSCDSSSWLYSIRFGAPSAPGGNAMGDAFSRFDTVYSYDQSLDRTEAGGLIHGLRFLAAEAFFLTTSTRNQQNDVRAHFGPDALLPPPDDLEDVRR